MTNGMISVAMAVMGRPSQRNGIRSNDDVEKDLTNCRIHYIMPRICHLLTVAEVVDKCECIAGFDMQISYLVRSLGLTVPSIVLTQTVFAS